MNHDEYKKQLKYSRDALIAGIAFMCSFIIILAAFAGKEL